MTAPYEPVCTRDEEGSVLVDGEFWFYYTEVPDLETAEIMADRQERSATRYRALITLLASETQG